MIIGQREGERCTQTQVGGKKRRIIAIVIRHLGAYVRDIPTPGPLTFAASDDGIGGVVSRDVGRESTGTRSLIAGITVAETQVTVDVAENNAHGEFLGEFARIADIYGHFVGVEALSGIPGRPGCIDFAQREIAQRGTDGLIVARADFVVCRQVGQEDIVDQFAQPRRIAQAHGGA